MKLLTLNTHSLVENDYEKKLQYFVEYVEKNDYDVIALQEVNQSILENKVECNEFYIASHKDIEIKKDNHMYKVVELLAQKGKKYYWTWTPIKVGYDIYDEGIGIISKYPPIEIKEFYVTDSKSYKNWKTRKIIGIKIKIDNEEKWAFSGHFGWWNDTEEDFKKQILKLNTELRFFDEEIYLLCDLNNCGTIKNEGYHYITDKGWYDSYYLASQKDDGFTTNGKIDGWTLDKNKMRIDYIFINEKVEVKYSKVVFDGENGEIISDHFGVEVEI